MGNAMSFRHFRIVLALQGRGGFILAGERHGCARGTARRADPTPTRAVCSHHHQHLGGGKGLAAARGENRRRAQARWQSLHAACMVAKPA